MTDPHNITEIASPVPTENITAIANFNECLWIGQKDGSIIVVQRSSDKNAAELVPMHHFSSARHNFMVRKMISVKEPMGMLVHYTGLAGQPGPVIFYRVGGLRTTVCATASLLLSSYTLANPTIAVFSGPNLTLYQFTGEIVTISKTFSVPSVIKSAAMSDKSIVFFSDSKYKIIDIKTGETTECPPNSVDHPCTHTLDASTILIFYKEFMAIADNPTKIRPYDPANGVPSFLFGNSENFYQFFQSTFTRTQMSDNINSESQAFEVQSVKLCSWLEERLVLVSSRPTLSVVGKLPMPKDLAQSILSQKVQEVDSILSTLPKKQRSDLCRSIFNLLWQQSPEAALVLGSKYQVSGDLTAIISLFPSIIIDRPFKGQNTLKESPKFEESKNLANNLKEFLIFQLSEAKADLTLRRMIRPLSTALAEVYSLLSNLRELTALIHKSLDVDMTSVNKFADKFDIKPAKAVFLTQSGKSSEAMEIWRSIIEKDPNPVYIKEASYTLRKVGNEQLGQYLDWLFSKSADDAVNSLLSKRHKPEAVINWLAERKLETQRLRYLDFVLSHPKSDPPYSVISSTFFDFISIIENIGTIDEKNLEWTEAYKNHSQNLRNDAKAELIAKAKKLLENYKDYIKAEDALKKTTNQDLIYTIYKVNEWYTEGIKLLMKDKPEVPYGDIEKFCREGKNPAAAFSAFFKIVKFDGSKQYLDFLKENLDWMEIVEVLKMLPRDSKLRSVTEIIRNAFILLEERQNNLRVQVGATSAIAIDVRYERSRAECRNCTIDEDTKCEVCGLKIGEGQFMMTLDDKAIHTHCKAK